MLEKQLNEKHRCEYERLQIDVDYANLKKREKEMDKKMEENQISLRDKEKQMNLAILMAVATIGISLILAGSLI